MFLCIYIISSIILLYDQISLKGAEEDVRVNVSRANYYSYVGMIYGIVNAVGVIMGAAGFMVGSFYGKRKEE